jgi:hypothetical protein
MMDLINVDAASARLISTALCHLVGSVARGAPGSYGAVADDLAGVADRPADAVPWEDLAGAIVRRIAAAGMPPPGPAVLDALMPPDVERK